MLTADQTDRPSVVTDSFCWSCGVPDPDSDPCPSCGAPPRPRPVAHSEMIGATASIRQRLRNRCGIVVAESPTSALLAFEDATVAEAPKEKLSDIVNAKNGARSTAWMLVSASRRVNADDRRKFDELVASFVLTLVGGSVDEARAFVLDALDADCPAWLDRIHLTTSERDFLYASYQADRGNTAAALERLLRLPEDRYPTKDLVFLRCSASIKEDANALDKVRRHLQPFDDRPIARTLLRTFGDEDLDDATWLGSAKAVLGKVAHTTEVNFPRALARRFVESMETGSSLPDDSWSLGAEARLHMLAHAARSGGPAPEVTLDDLQGAPDPLIDEAIDLGVLTVSTSDRDQPLARYALSRTDPEALTHDDLVELGYTSELARRAFLRSDRESLESLPRSPAIDQLRVLDALRAGDFRGASRGVEHFEGQARDKVTSIAESLAEGSIDSATNEVLTDGTTWPILASLLPDDPAALNTLSATRPALRGIAAWRALSGSLSRLWEWDWEGALTEAKRCLIVARDEQTRDEALNLIACAKWELGDEAGAVAALSSALEGSYTEGLQVNIGVVAASLEPQLAGEHLGKLAVEAPTLQMRVAGAGRALELWYADPDPWDTQESEHSLPTQLRDALRALVRSDIDEVAFVRFTRTMSRWDEDWLAEAGNLVGSPFEGSAAAAVYQAKARDFEEFVKALADVVIQETPPEWATDERDNLVGSAIAALDPDEANPMAASFGLMLIDGGLPMEARVYIDLVAFTVVGVCAGIDPTEGEPKERFLDLVVQARERIGEVSAEEQDRSNKILDFATSRVIGSIAAARANQYDQVVDLFNRVASQLYGVPSRQINRGAVRSGTQSAVDFLADSVRILDRLIAHAPAEDLRQRLTEFRDEVRQLRASFDRLRGS